MIMSPGFCRREPTSHRLSWSAPASLESPNDLKKQAEAQFAVKESELVDAVKKVLARNNVTWG
jgi:hypothetical protein